MISRTRSRTARSVGTRGRARSVEVIEGDAAGRLAEMEVSIAEGLGSESKSLPTRWLFDSEGVSLLRAIREQPEYYQVRAERKLLADRSYALPLYFPDEPPTFVEIGVVDAERTAALIRPLVEAFGDLRYIAVGPDEGAVAPPSRELAEMFPTLNATAMVGRLVDAIREVRVRQNPVVLYWPESGVGGYERSDVGAVMREISAALRPADLFIAGIDLRKDPRIVQRAYRDRIGHSRRLQLNALERINDTLGGHFDISNFRDRVVYDAASGRLETSIVSRRAHSVRVDAVGCEFSFAKGEAVRTVTATKFSPREIDHAAGAVGLAVHERWYDRDGRVCSNLMRPHAVPSDHVDRRRWYPG